MSPWGKIQQVTKFLPGVSFVSTPGHGGFRVSLKKAHKYIINSEEVIKLAGQVIGNYVFFEEDCAYALFLNDAPTVLIAVAKLEGRDPDEFFKSVHETAKNWFPSFFEVED